MKTKSLLLAGALLLAGCGLQPVQPWQREDLARPEMAWERGLVEEGAIRSHTYQSKEAAIGGPALGGGGCGCN
ncbi:DUF4266 domain-containing protein [Stagnimonas aquatica]|uniref:DUF4266 domain-containing protein n=1 Tax=Stagnimonas aquatica TaxID=2689987 RepID=A0A3N0VA24_9GAMM|nr:DUF4266 domain-containing protein [Stagnimonas aquatica]ROH89512.1 DUF4266 domain-containing protein [Stagnimonas aquatica]